MKEHWLESQKTGTVVISYVREISGYLLFPVPWYREARKVFVEPGTCPSLGSALRTLARL